MITNIQKLKKAREMRLSGSSLSEISKEIHISRSSLSIWLKDIVLTELQINEMKKRVSGRMSRGRLNASIKIRSKRVYQEKKIYDQAKREFVHLSEDPVFMSGLTMYQLNGTKQGTSFQFACSDQNIVNFMIFWVKRYLKIEEILIKKRNYGGYLRLDISRVEILRRVLSWQKLLVQYMMDKQV